MAVLHHYIEYGVSDAVPVAEVAESLLANERLLRQAAKVLEDLYPGLTARVGEVSVKEITQQSPLREYILYTLLLTFQEDLKREVPNMINALLGVGVPEKYDTFVTVLVMLIAIYGVSKVYEHFFPDRSKENLQGDQNRLLVVAGDYIGLPPERIGQAVERATGGRDSRGIKSAAQKFFAPARGERKVSIFSDDNKGFISPAAVAEAQSVSSFPLPDEREEDVPPPEFHEDVEIIVHAMDRDKGRSGWAGHIPSLFTDRVRMRLDKSIEPEGLFGLGTIHGDVLVEYGLDPNGEPKATAITLLRVGRPATH